MEAPRIMRSVLFVLLVFGIMAWNNAARAHGKHPHPEHNLAKASQNPISSLISVPFENNATINNGPFDKFIDVLNIKPVVPVKLTENWNLVNRAIVPIEYQEEMIPMTGSKFGMGDITYQGFFTKAHPGKIIWAVGPALSFPTGAQRMTSDKWSAGPAAVVLTMPGHWVIGALVYNLWSYHGDDDAADVNEFILQYFINYNIGKKGWYVNSAPVITANWEADGGDVWTVPFGAGVGRVFKIGKQPVNVKFDLYYNVWAPDNASDWNVQFSWTFLFPKKPK